MIRHLIHADFRERTVCGRLEESVLASLDPTDTTCARCKRTSAYATAVSDEAHRHVVKNALDLFIDRLNRIAQDRGYCSDYDDIMEEAAESLPSWYVIEPRQREYRIDAAYSATITAASEEEAWERLAEDPSSYLSLSEA